MAETAKAQDAIRYISSDDREMWVVIGQAVKSEFGDSGFNIWDDWSRSSSSYNERDAQAVWRSFKGGGVTIGTLYHHAKQNGWTPPAGHTNTSTTQRTASIAPIWTPILPIPADAPAPPTEHSRHGKPSNKWRYLSADHELLQLVYRFDTGDNSKQVLPLTYCTNGTRKEWRWQALPEPRPLYGLETIGTAERVLFVEGEKATDAARRLLGPQIPVLSWPGGSGAVAKADYSPLAGKTIAICPDADTPGIKAALALITVLEANGCTVKVIEPPAGVAQGWDLADAELEGWIGQQVRNHIKSNSRSSADYRKQHNDLAAAAGIGEVRRQIEAAAAPEVEPLRSNEAGSLAVTRGCDIHPKAIEWLWPGWLAAGKFHVLAGAPGTGKTTIAVKLAAIMTIGGKWPDGSRAQVADVAIWSGEDDPQDTLAPRFIAAGADMKRVHFIQGVSIADGKRAFDPSADMPVLKHFLSQNQQIKMLIIDPIVSAVSGDSHKNTEVRRGLQPLVDLVNDCGCALFGISHFSKGTSGKDPVERVTGSIAFGALARIVLAAAKIEDDSLPEGTRLFARAKSNIGIDSGGWHYRLETTELKEYQGVFTSAVLWGDAVEGSARELLTAADSTDEEGGSALDEAKAFLEDALALGPVGVKKIMTDARQAGISEKTLKRAKAGLKIKAEKSGFDSGWKWEIPAKGAKYTEEGHTNSVAPLGNLGPLREELPHQSSRILSIDIDDLYDGEGVLFDDAG